MEKGCELAMGHAWFGRGQEGSRCGFAVSSTEAQPLISESSSFYRLS